MMSNKEGSPPLSANYHPMCSFFLFTYLYCQLPVIVSVGYPEAVESLIRRIAQRRLLVGLHNQYLNQLVRGIWESSASNRTLCVTICHMRYSTDESHRL